MNDYYMLIDSQGIATEVVSEIKIGRAKDNDVVVSDPLASRHHATVFMEGDSLLVRDENSVNGTLVNGHQIYEPVKLKDLDEIKVGDEVLVVRAPLEISKTIMSSSPRDEFQAAGTVLSKQKEEPVTTVQQDEENSGELLEDRKGIGFDPAQKNSRVILIFAVLAFLVLFFCCVSMILIYFFVFRASSSLLILYGFISELSWFALV